MFKYFNTRKKISNVFVINKDIKDVVLEDIGDKISVIRVNNIWCYIQNFQDYIPKYKSLLMQKGVFLFQEYSYVKVLNLENNPYTWLDNCFKDNWEKEFTIQNTENIRLLIHLFIISYLLDYQFLLLDFRLSYYSGNFNSSINFPSFNFSIPSLI